MQLMWHSLDTPKGFRFKPTVLSHGWVFLSPFQWDGIVLQIPLSFGRKRVEILLKSSRDRSVSIGFPRDFSATQRTWVDAMARWVLRLDEDLAPLRSVDDPLVRAALRRGAGRLLRAPTIWEEATRILCTTNVQWAGTVAMMAGLTKLGGGVFPSPRKILALGEETLRTDARMGYRAASLVALAGRIEAGDDLEQWKIACPPPDEVAAQVKSWPGFGPYAVAHMLVQLGHYAHLPIDSEVRAFHPDTSDAAIRALYAPFGDHAFLVYKLRRVALKRNWIGEPAAATSAAKARVR